MKLVMLAGWTLSLVLARGAAQEGVVERAGGADPTIRILDLADGTAYERGLQHGTALKADIQKIVTLWKKDLKENLEVDPEAFIAKFHRARAFFSISR